MALAPVLTFRRLRQHICIVFNTAEFTLRVFHPIFFFPTGEKQSNGGGGGRNGFGKDHSDSAIFGGGGVRCNRRELVSV